MKQIAYLEIIKQALKITWKNKFLWLFGFLVFLGSVPTSFNGNGSVEQNEKIQKIILGYIQENPKFFIGLVLVFILLAVIFFVLRIIATAAIIKSVNNIAVYGKSKILAIFSEVKKYLWRLVLLEIIVGVVFLILIIILATPVFYLWILKANVSAIVSAVVAFFIFLVLLVIAQYLRTYSYFYIVIADIEIRKAIEMSYLLFRQNIWESLIMGAIGIAVGMATMIAIFVFALAAIVIFIPFGLIAYLIFAKTGALVILVLGIGVACIAGLILASFLTAFMQTAWVLFFKEISLEKKEDVFLEKTEAVENIPDPETI